MASRTKLILDGENRTQRAFREVDRSLGRLGQSVGRLSGLLAGGLFARAIVDATRFADRVDKLSTRLGTTTEFLSQMKFAADQTGVSFETLSTGIQRLQRRVSEAASGTGEAQAALRELGLDATRLEQLSLEEQFDIVAESLNNVTSSADRTRLAMRLFDTEGVALLQTMEGGAAAVQALRQEADLLGATIDGRISERAADASDAISRLQTTFNGLVRELALSVAPGLSTIANFLSTSIPRAALTAQQAVLNFTSSVSSALATASSGLAGFLESAPESIRRGLDAFFIPQTLNETADSLRNVAENAAGAAIQVGETYNALIRVQELQRGAQAPTAVQDLVSQAADIPAFLTPDFTDEYLNSLRDVTESGETTEILQGISTNLTDSLVNGIVNAGDGMREAFRAILADLAAQLLRSSLIQAFSSIGSFFGFGGGPRGLQAGGFAGPGVYRVGEAGPETVAIGQGAMVYANRLGGNGEAISLNYNVDARGADANAAARVERAIRQSQRETIATVKDLNRRGRL